MSEQNQEMKTPVAEAPVKDVAAKEPAPLTPVTAEPKTEAAAKPVPKGADVKIPAPSSPPKLIAGEPVSAKAAGASRLSQAAQGRWAAPAAAAALAAILGWYGGAQSSALGRATAQNALAGHAFTVEMEKHASALAAVDKRLGAMESAGGDSAALKRSIDILARRLDEVGRAQTASAAQATVRLDKSDKDMAQKLDRLGERIERIEKQVSSPAPVASIPKPVAAPASTKLPDLPEKPAAPDKSVDKGADKTSDKAVRGYVLREVFRGGALVEGRFGEMEVFPGAELPGAGRVRSIERREGKWVVVTTAGVIGYD
ncbi:MAG: hypothetical protein JWN93_3673 [Hyphomicrobiales bacterium]|nr:hypothetical protein [Hyphomicrobiales bacterium]